MDPPPFRPSVRSRETMSERGGKSKSRSVSRSREQTETTGFQSRALHKRRESEVLVPPFGNTKAGPSAEIKAALNSNMDSASITPPSAGWALSQDGTRSVVQEVHKIVLSDISTVEFFHAKEPNPFPNYGWSPIQQESRTGLQQARTAEPASATTATSPKEGDPKLRRLAPRCLYRIEYRDENDVLVYDREGSSMAEIKHPQRIDEPVMEVITTVAVKRGSKSNNDDFNPELTKGTDQGTEVKINSPLLVNALRAVVSYYPGSNLLEEPLTFSEPYRMLVHYRNDLKAYKDNHSPNHTQEYREECNQHIDILLGFLHQNFDGGLELEEARYQQDPPMCTYEYLWMLFKPGVDIYTITEDYPRNCPKSVVVVSSILGGQVQHEYEPYRVYTWNLQSDGENLRRSPAHVEIIPFDGEKEIRSLNAYPTSFMEEEERKEIEQRLISRGKRYYDYTSISHKHFRGYTLSDPRRPSKYDTRVILDSAEFFNTYRFDQASAFVGIDEEEDKKLLDMDAIHDISFDKDSIDDLVLDPEENKTLLKALAKRYTQKPADIDILPPVIKNNMTVIESNKNEPWAADFVEGKGEGQIVLLHGPPGVGKTFTAESIAEFTERPLLSLSCSDIGTSAETVDHNLKAWMKRARRWGAVLLIDEADVYLEERTAQDFERNSLVSVFLRNLEYYQGILFLTTNRVGVFDEAFASRIHISIWYPGFDDVKRIKIWKTMIKRLERERKDIWVPYDFKKYIENDEDLKRVEWNGREIRNAFQTAVALAEFQGTEENLTKIELRFDYLDQVVKMSRRFKEYLSTLPEGNVAKKALRYGKRNDDRGFGAEGRISFWTAHANAKWANVEIKNEKADSSSSKHKMSLQTLEGESQRCEQGRLNDEKLITSLACPLILGVAISYGLGGQDQQQNPRYEQYHDL
ncbi:hypothetical protein GP486_002012 [Trichoglossum hirsutum]|uniref:AAA+ ATPase domain-containing protein n=1 Tax=Trichoglossum hirsutum TaxID=265104 RepID=A0A9P8RS60_9PEZI|nr:hypothetical protein GP486_002012 [Trichoglossum hirsutum]